MAAKGKAIIQDSKKSKRNRYIPEISPREDLKIQVVIFKTRRLKEWN
jgi:hypothetical protein